MYQAKDTLLYFFLTLFLALFMAGCGGGGAGGGGGSGGGGGGTPAATAKSIALASSATSVKSDNSDTVTITATVLDTNNVVLANQPVSFKASTGVIMAAGTSTDSNGKVTATFASGTLEKTNRTAIITVTVTGTSVSGSLPVQITGSTLSLSTGNTSPMAGIPVTVTATAKTFSANVPGQTLRYSIAPSSTGSGSLNVLTGTTNSSGQAQVSFTGSAAGVVNLLVEWLDDQGAAVVSAIQSFNVQASGAAFQVNYPLPATGPNMACNASPCPVTLSTTRTLSVNVPATIDGVPVGSLRYATSLGSWGGSAKTQIVNSPAGTDTQTFHADTNAGNANVQIEAFSGANATGSLLATAKLLFALSASAASAHTITLQANAYNLSPSTGGTSSIATLTATVRDAANNAVGGASVLFELVNPTGSGEQIDPVVVSTNSLGVAQSTFIAGSQSTTQMSQIKATVVGTGIVSLPMSITVGGTAGSIAIGTSTEVFSTNNNTSYKLPVTILVTDSNGNAVSGAVVSLSLWPLGYNQGNRPKTADGCPAVITAYYPNEDSNENLIWDAGEPDFNSDGSMTPAASTVGAVPTSVTTGTDGTATFDWIYLKEYADWIVARLRASTLVQGTEATTTAHIALPPSKDDVAACLLPSSPF